MLRTLQRTGASANDLLTGLASLDLPALQDDIQDTLAVIRQTARQHADTTAVAQLALTAVVLAVASLVGWWAGGKVADWMGDL